MLQQTQVDRVVSKYAPFLDAFPDVVSLAGAPLTDVLRVWQGLGYSRRAVNLQRAVQDVLMHYGGCVPSSTQELVTLPGVGRTTAGAIAAFAFNTASVFIETNVRSAFLDFFFAETDGVPDAKIMPLVEATLDRDNPREWYWALMDYGATLKKQGTNPSRRSAHHRAQPKFEGSNRQLRGRVLRALTEHGAASASRLSRLADANRARVDAVLVELRNEGFLVKEGRIFRIS